MQTDCSNIVNNIPFKTIKTCETKRILPYSKYMILHKTTAHTPETCHKAVFRIRIQKPKQDCIITRLYYLLLWNKIWNQCLDCVILEFMLKLSL